MLLLLVTFVMLYIVDCRKVRYLVSNRGQFDFAMSLYETKSFVSPYIRGATIPVGTPVFAKIDFLTSGNFNMFVQACYASPVPGLSQYKYDLIKEGG